MTRNSAAGLLGNIANLVSFSVCSRVDLLPTDRHSVRGKVRVRRLVSGVRQVTVERCSSCCHDERLAMVIYDLGECSVRCGDDHLQAEAARIMCGKRADGQRRGLARSERDIFLGEEVDSQWSQPISRDGHLLGNGVWRIKIKTHPCCFSRTLCIALEVGSSEWSAAVLQYFHVRNVDTLLHVTAECHSG